MQVIESITIRYFRSVYTLTLSPCNHITVITGKNDVGKSNILKALNLFFNQQSDYMKIFDFTEDYSLLRKEEVRKDTIRGQQFISITIKFLRGDRMVSSLPPSFSITRRWDMHSQEYKQTTDVYVRMQRYAKKNGIKYSEKTTSRFLSMFINNISFIYIPAIKDISVFNGTLNWLQKSLFNEKNKHILDEPIGNANVAVQNIVGELQNDFAKATGINNFVELPNTLSYTSGLLQINTEIEGGIVSLDKHGDGIRTHYIPKILNYVAMHSKKMFIWGFEEPENSYEYRRCIQVAEEFEQQYSKNSQIFITSHSPAFYHNSTENKTVVNVGYDKNKTVLLSNANNLDEELGYIKLYQNFIDDIKALQKSNKEKESDIKKLFELIEKNNAPLILTEGKTDAALLKIAISKLGLSQYNTWTIKEVASNQTSNNEALLKFLMELRDNTTSNRLIIGMFDRDTKLEIKENLGSYDIRNKKYTKLSKNLFAFAIPVPHNREEEEQISIEHYFTDEEIKTEKDGKRLFIGNEFHATGVHKNNTMFYKGAAKVANTIKIIEHETKNYVTNLDGSGDYSISKAAFTQSIMEGHESFANISFDEFKNIFDVISEIKAECDAEALGEEL